jgi:hypothetical protein
VETWLRQRLTVVSNDSLAAVPTAASKPLNKQLLQTAIWGWTAAQLAALQARSALASEAPLA